MTEFIHEIDSDCDIFTAADEIERSTGWADSYRVEFDDGAIVCCEFFDAELNQLFECSPIGELGSVIASVAEERW